MANADVPPISQMAEYLRAFFVYIEERGQDMLRGRDQGYLPPVEVQRLFLPETRRTLTNIKDGRYDQDCVYYERYADAYLRIYEYLRTRAHFPARVLLRDHEPSSAEEAFVHDTIRQLLQHLHRPLTYVQGREPSVNTAGHFPEEPLGIPPPILTLWQLNAESITQRISTREENIRMITFLVRLMTAMQAAPDHAAAALPAAASAVPDHVEAAAPPAAASAVPDHVEAAAPPAAASAVPDHAAEAAPPAAASAVPDHAEEEAWDMALFDVEPAEELQFEQHVDPFGLPQYQGPANFDDLLLPDFQQVFFAEEDGMVINLL